MARRARLGADGTGVPADPAPVCAVPAWGLALPAIAATYVLFTFDSAYQHLRGRGGAWKGRSPVQASARAATGP